MFSVARPIRLCLRKLQECALASLNGRRIAARPQKRHEYHKLSIPNRPDNGIAIAIPCTVWVSTMLQQWVKHCHIAVVDNTEHSFRQALFVTGVRFRQQLNGW